MDANTVGVYDCTFITKAKQNKDLICNPIYYLTNSEIWEFIHDRGMKYNPLYDKGMTRVGCIGCPLNTNSRIELEKYPKYKLNYIRAFDRMLQKRREAGKDDITGKTGLHKWTNGEAVYRWWIRDDTIDGQTTIFDYIEKGENE